MTAVSQFLADLQQQHAVLVTVQSHSGSVPRQAGAWMAVFADHTVGTVGGGQLEWQAIERARARLTGETGEPVLRYALGPSLGQCCGGVVFLSYASVSKDDIAHLRQRFAEVQSQWPVVAVFGAGHVGQALVRLLLQLPMQLRWLDNRDGLFPAGLPEHLVCETSEPVSAAVQALPAGAAMLVMSHSHVHDYDLVLAGLTRLRQHADLGFLGLIGSKTKWASFRKRLLARGFSEAELARVICPIGLPGIAGREPEVIAVSVAAQLLQVLRSASATGEPRHNPAAVLP